MRCNSGSSPPCSTRRASSRPERTTHPPAMPSMSSPKPRKGPSGTRRERNRDPWGLRSSRHCRSHPLPGTPRCRPGTRRARDHQAPLDRQTNDRCKRCSCVSISPTSGNGAEIARPAAERDPPPDAGGHSRDRGLCRADCSTTNPAGIRCRILRWGRLEAGRYRPAEGAAAPCSPVPSHRAGHSCVRLSAVGRFGPRGPRGSGCRRKVSVRPTRRIAATRAAVAEMAELLDGRTLVGPSREPARAM